jgi:hypothetical protein
MEGDINHIRLCTSDSVIEKHVTEQNWQGLSGEQATDGVTENFRQYEEITCANEQRDTAHKMM